MGTLILLLVSSTTTLLLSTTSAQQVHFANNQWNLQIGDPSRDGRLLNIPLHYGDWVPISKAKALVENVATKLSGGHHQLAGAHQAQQAAPKVDVEPPTEIADERIDIGEPEYQHPHTYHHQYQQQHQQQQFQPQQQQFRPVHNAPRRQDNYNTVRFPYHGGAQPQHVNNGNRRNRKLPPPSHQNNFINTQFNNGKPQKNKPVKFAKPSTFVPSINPLNQIFNFFDNSAGPTRPTNPPPTRPTSFQLVGSQPAVPQVPAPQGAIRPIPAPDLTKIGPPVIELDSKDGEIILGQTFNNGNENRDHLAGFVSLDFDEFSTGDREDKNKLSLLVGGNKLFDKDVETELVNLLNNGQEDPPTFLLNGEDDTPDGFTKIDIPFMDPTEHKGILPKVFIAPIGKPIPNGYKGRPLPSNPIGGVEVTTEKILAFDQRLEEQTDRNTKIFEQRKPVPIISLATESTTVTPTTTSALNSLFRFKSQKERPSLAEFYLKNKKKLKEEERRADRLTDKNKFQRSRSSSTVNPEDFTSFRPTTIPSTEETEVENVDNDIRLFGQDDPIEEIYNSEEGHPIIHLPPVLVKSTWEYAEEKETSTAATTETTTTTSTTTTTTTTTTTYTTTSTFTSTTTTTSITTTTTTTTTTTSTVTTTTTPELTTTTTNIFFRTTNDPIKRLEYLRKKAEEKAKKFYVDDLDVGDDTEEDEEVTEASAFEPIKKRFRFRKYNNFGGAENFEGPVRKRKISRRIKTKLRPAGKFFAPNKFENSQEVSEENEGIVPTFRPGAYIRRNQRPVFKYTEATTETTPSVVNAEQYKKKFRPFFDKIYSQFSQNAVATSGQPVLRRSTTAYPPVTQEAHIYEVDPETRVRITPRVPVTQSTIPPLPPFELTEDSYTDDNEISTESFDDVYEEEAVELERVSSTEEYGEATTTEESRYYEPTVLNYEELTKTTPETIPTRTETLAVTTSTQAAVEQSTTTFEYTSAGPSTTTTVQEPEGTTEDIHETADKHTVYQINAEDVIFDLINVDVSTENVLNVEATSVENFEENTTDADQYQEESQKVESWTEEDDSFAPTPSIPTRLTNYKKDIDTSLFGEDHEYNVEELVGHQVNEHGQNIMEHVDDGSDDVVSDNYESTSEAYGNNNGWAPISYVEIDRSKSGTPVASVEEIELTESIDYSEPDIIYDESKEGFHDDSAAAKKNRFAFPVSASFNLPRTTESATAKQEPTTTFAAPTTTTTTVEPSTTVETRTTTLKEVAPSTTTTTAAPETETTTRFFRRRWFTTTLKTTEELSTTPEITTESAASPQQPDDDEIVQTSNDLAEVFLGTQSPVDQNVVSSSPDSEYPVIDISKPLYSTKDRPTSLWSVYQKNKDSRPTWGQVNVQNNNEEENNESTEQADIEDESATEGYNVASIMSYATVDDTENNEEVENESNDEVDEVTRTSSSISKVFSYAQPALPAYPHGEIKIHSFGKELTTTTSKPTTSKGLAKKREWVKNWVSRNYNKPKFPRGPFIPVTLQIIETSSSSTPSLEENEIEPVQEQQQLKSFPPTIPPPQQTSEQTADESTSTPKNSRFTVNLDVTVRDGSEEKVSGGAAASLFDKSALYDKYSNRKKASSIFLNRDQSAQPWIKEVQPQQPEPTSSTTPVVAVPNFRPAAILGASNERIRSYGGRQLSQSDFERSILGVSTAQEISVKSTICVKGKCFDPNELKS